MYNELIKKRFIEFTLNKSKVKEVEKYESQLINFFDRLEEIEQELDKDFAMCNFEEVKIVLSVLCRRSVKYQKSILSQLRQYLDWCIDTKNSLDSENRLIGITPKDIEYSLSYKMSMIKDEEQLQHYLDSVLKPINDDTIDNIYRGALHLVFNGFTFKEAIELKKTDIDFDNKTIKYKDRVITISDICCDILRYLDKMEVCLVPKIKGGERERELIDTGHILERTVPNRENMTVSMIPNISLIFKSIKTEFGYKISITLNDLLMSGIFYRICMKEIETGGLDFSEYLMKYANQTFAISHPDFIIEEGKEEYGSWKKAFNLE